MTQRGKSVGQFVAGVVSVGLLILTTRAVIAYRAWTMTVTWAHLTALPSPAGITFFSPSLFFYTNSGVFNDVAFIRVPYSETEEEGIRSRLLASSGLISAPVTKLSLPLPAEDATGCGHDKTLYRNQLFIASPQNWSMCYRLIDPFDVASVNQGEAWYIGDHGRVGGLVVLDTNRHYLYIAAYRADSL